MRVGSRRRDRRCGWADFLAFLAGGLHAGRDPRALRTRFEDGLRRLLPARALMLREVEGTIPRLRGQTPEPMTLDVPGSPERPPFALETVFEPGCGPDECDVQMLEAARYVAALVLEIERLALGPGWLGVTRGETHHAIVGSSDPIRELRDRISRLAATDFTVLVEGAIDPEVETQFRRRFASQPQDWEMEGTGEALTLVGLRPARSPKDSVRLGQGFGAPGRVPWPSKPGGAGSIPGGRANLRSRSITRALPPPPRLQRPIRGYNGPTPAAPTAGY
jgi:hypothetical protein